MPQESGKIEFANTLRGVAAFVVMLAHYAVVFWQYREVAANLTNSTPLTADVATPGYLLALKVFEPLSLGIFGVALFFLISGFVIPFSFTRLDWRGFLAGRALRIYPTYWAGLCVSIAVIAICGTVFDRAFPYSAGVVATNFLPGLRDIVWVPGIDGIIWTLDIEIKFYLVCAMSFRLLAAGSKGLFAVPLVLSLPAIIVAPMVNVLLRSGNPAYGYLYTFCASVQYLDFMFIGVAFNFLYRQLISVRMFAATAVLLFAAMCAICWRATIVPFELMWTYGSALVLFTAAFCFPSLFGSRTLTDFLAAISYPLYVTHGVLGYALLRWATGAGLSAWLSILLAAGSAIAVATLIHYAIEIRAHRTGRTLSARLSQRISRGETG